MYKALFLSLTLLCQPIFGEITQMKNMKQVEALCNQADRDTLVIFDIDMTLTIPTNPALQMPNVKMYKSRFKKYKALWSKDQKTIITNFIGLNNSPKLLDPHTKLLIKSLQRRNIPTIALTATLAGPILDIQDVISYRDDLLKKLDIDFSVTSPSQDYFIFDDLLPYLGGYPQTKKGIILANGEKNMKGVVLTRFLEAIDWTPQKVIFIDDDLSQVESMENSMGKLGVQFEGVHFRAIDDFVADKISPEDFDVEWENLHLLSIEVMREKNL
ncbi:MAG: DUF2608 domain-containing protein [Chlamydiota bacterium]|nr:DUF2608 domain-containing protein [Chlamydiota bacterium]